MKIPTRHVLAVLTLGILSAASRLRVSFAQSTAEVERIAEGVANLVNDIAEEQMGVSFLTKAMSDQALYREIASNGTGFVEGLSAKLKERLDLRLDQLDRIKSAVNGLYAEDSSGIQPDNRIEQCCDVSESRLEYSPRFRAKVGQRICMRVPRGDVEFRDLYDSSVGKLVRDPRLKDAFLQNVQESPEIKWQYYGANTNGVYAIWPEKNRPKCDDYDPRHRPWFVHAASVPKNVLVILDSSGSMSQYGRMTAAKAAAKTVLSTLNPEDAFGVIDFDSDARTINTADQYDRCLSSQLVNATPSNLNKLSSWLSNLPDSGGTDFVRAFGKGFDILEASFAANPELKKRPTAVLFLTDGDAADPRASIRARKESMNLENFFVFTFALGRGISWQSENILRGIASENDGAFIQVDDGSPAQLRNSMAEYYAHAGLMKAEDQSSTILTVPYFDASGIGMVVTMAAPIMRAGSLEGVAAVDLTLNDLLDSAIGYTSTNGDSYAFVLDSHGRVLLHPTLPSPTDYESDPVFVFLDELERPVLESESFAPVLASIMAGESGSKHFNEIRRFKRRGGDHEGTSEVYTSGTYFWAPAKSRVEGIQLRVGFFLADSDVTGERFAYSGPSVEKNVYQRIDLDEVDNMCTYYGSVASFDHTSVAFAPRLFRDPNSYLDGAESESNVKFINQLLQTGTPSQIASNQILTPDAVYEARATMAIDSFWTKFKDPDADETVTGLSKNMQKVHVLWRYVGTAQGAWRSYPNHPVVKGYDNTLRAWYIRSQNAPRLFTMSTPYEDASGAGMVQTLSKAILSPNGKKVAAVIGIDYTIDGFKELLKSYTSMFDYDAYLIDQQGYILADATGGYDGQYLGDSSRAANGLIEGNLLQQETCANYETGRLEVHYSIKSVTATTTVSCKRGGSVVLAPVPGTSFFLAINQDCNPDGNSLCYERMTCSQWQIQNSRDLCPCNAELGYWVCKQRWQSELTRGTHLPVCAPKAPSLIPQPKSSEEIDLLDSLSRCKQDNGSGGSKGSSATVPVVIGVLAVVAGVAGYVYMKKKKASSSGGSSGHTPNANPWNKPTKAKDVDVEIPVASVVNPPNKVWTATRV